MIPGFHIEGDKELSEALQAKQAGITERLYDRVRTAQRALADKVRINLSGEVLQQRSGELYRSVQEQPIVQEGTAVIGEVTVGNENTPYAPVQERGGVREYVIRPVNKSVLTFVIDGKRIFTMMVKRTPLPARYYFGRAVDEVGPEVIEALSGKLFE